MLKISGWKLTNFSDDICSQSWQHAEHWRRHDEEVHRCHQVSNKTRILQKKLLFSFFRNQKEGQPGSWTTYGSVKVFKWPLVLHYEMHLRLRLWVFVNRTLLRSIWRIQDLLNWWRNTTQYWRGKNPAKAIHDRCQEWNGIHSIYILNKFKDNFHSRLLPLKFILTCLLETSKLSKTYPKTFFRFRYFIPISLMAPNSSARTMATLVFLM